MTRLSPLPTLWPQVGSTRSLFTERLWIELFAARIEGDHVWPVVEHAGASYCLMGSVIHDDLGSEAKNVRRLLTSECLSLRTLERGPAAALADITPAAPAPEEWTPSLIYLLPGFECRLATDAAHPSGAAVEELVRQALVVGDDVDAAIVAFLFVPPAETALLAALEASGLRALKGAARESTLQLPGSSFDDYLNWLNSSRRADLRSTYREVESWGTSFSRPALQDMIDDLVEIMVAERLKHGRRPAREENLAYLESLCAFPEGRVQLLCAWTGGALSGFSIMLETAPGLRHLMGQGVASGTAPYAALRLALNFYEPIRSAYADGVRELSFGYGSESNKRRRGCTTTGLPAFVHARTEPLRRYVSDVADRVFHG